MFVEKSGFGRPKKSPNKKKWWNFIIIRALISLNLLSEAYKNTNNNLSKFFLNFVLKTGAWIRIKI